MKMENEDSGTKGSVINSKWILLDTCSTVSICFNEDLIRHIRKSEVDEELTVITNGEKQTFKNMAILKYMPLQVYFKSDSLANIISLRNVANIPGVSITMDTEKERGTMVKMNSKKSIHYWNALMDCIILIHIYYVL